MKQILIQKNSQIKEESGSRIRFFNKADDSEFSLEIDSDHVAKIMIPFKAKILSGGTLDLDFSLTEEMAAAGVTLLGAYWNGVHITAYYRALDGTSVKVPSTSAVLVGTLVAVTTFRQIEDGILGNVMNVRKSGEVIAIEPAPAAKNKRRRART